MSTQSPHNFKTIYEFTIEVPREIEKETTRQEGDKTITEKVKVKELVPQFFCFKKPSRAEREEADAYRAGQWTELVQRGILPEALLLKRYANDGGILSKEEASNFLQLRAELAEKLEEYQRARVTGADEAAFDLMKEALTIQDEITTIQREQSVFFENTAEARARNKLTQYLALMFTYTRDSVEKPWEPYFKGFNIEEKYASLDVLEEANDDTFFKVWSRVEMLSILFISSGGTISAEEIKAFDAQFKPVTAPEAPAADVAAPKA